MEGNHISKSTVESRFLEPSVSRTSRYLEPNLVSLGFASKLYNFIPDFSNPRFLETPDNSNQFWLPWDKLTLDNSNLRKFRNHLVRTSITFTPLNELTLPDKLFYRIFITQQATNPSVISLKGTMTVFCFVTFLFFKFSTFCLWIKVKIYIKKNLFLLKFEHLLIITQYPAN